VRNDRSGVVGPVEVDAWSILHGLRIGCVQYLNSRPLIHDYHGRMQLAHPSELARELAADRLDAALVPIFEVLRDPRYTLVDDVAIACDGPVCSVFLAYRGELKAIRSVALDPASLTSVNLLRVLLREFHDAAPAFGSEGEAQLLIGNQAIGFLDGQGADSDWQILDLGEEWRRCTGLPFVFAAWALRPGLRNVHGIADAFRALKAHGLSHLDEVIAGDSTSTPQFRRRYLTEFIRFDLRDREKVGLQRFRKLLGKHGQITDTTTALQFV
jgi:chorismate dehydratase